MRVEQDVGNLVRLLGKRDLTIRIFGFINETLAVSIYQNRTIIKQ